MRIGMLSVIALALATTSAMTATSMGAQPVQRRAESFEKAPAGPLTKLTTTVGRWLGESGHAEITRHTARSGRQALRIFGGKEQTV